MMQANTSDDMINDSHTGLVGLHNQNTSDLNERADITRGHLNLSNATKPDAAAKLLMHPTFVNPDKNMRMDL
jgi:hypothetical protein